MRIINFDNLCALRCIVVGIAHNNYIENKEHYNEYKQIINSRKSKKQSIEAQRLAQVSSIINRSNKNVLDC